MSVESKMHELAINSLIEIQKLLAGIDRPNLSQPDIMNEIAIVIEQYEEDIDSLEKTGVNDLIPSESVQAEDAPFVPERNKGFFSDKAKTSYLRKNNLSEIDFELLSASEKNKHRIGIKKIYDELIKNQTLRIEASVYSANPFGAVKRTQLEESLEKQPITKAQQEWINEQRNVIEEKIESVNRMLLDTKKRLTQDKVSGQLYGATQEKITELETERKELQKNLQQYLINV